jgi:dTMP kinase
MDGVDASFLWQLNQHADTPDLTIILVGRPARSRARAHRRGIYSRFHRGPATAGVIEQRLYRDAAAALSALGHSVLVHDVQLAPPEAVAGTLLDEILRRVGGSG